MGQFSSGTGYLGVICPRGNYEGDKSFERQFSSDAISRGILSRGHYLLGNCPETIIWVASSKAKFSREHFSSGAIILRGNNRGDHPGGKSLGTIFLGVNCPGGNNPGGNHPGSNCLGGNYPGGNSPRGQLSRQQFYYFI